MSSLATPAPSRCPLCGEANRCAMEVERSTGVKQPPCWCTQVKFEHAVLERIPPQARRLACVCRACATRSLSNK
ncbi:cysteine-rich CWC family protein [Polaromonas sp.]|uniref:cysteine-rich CWC family protein n=1 Tax=Polaromonas sp. TaxID=1869339 RepID=UPI002FCAE655